MKYAAMGTPDRRCSAIFPQAGGGPLSRERHPPRSARPLSTHRLSARPPPVGFRKIGPVYGAPSPSTVVFCAVDLGTPASPTLPAPARGPSAWYTSVCWSRRSCASARTHPRDNLRRVRQLPSAGSIFCRRCWGGVSRGRRDGKRKVESA